MRRTPRLLGSATAVALSLGALTLGAAAPAFAAPETDFEMPFPCGHEWTGTTRASHSPSSKSVDWNRPDDVDDPVVAAASGTVEVAVSRSTSGYGRWVKIDHGSGESTIYAHLNRVAVAEGQTVDQGTLLGTVGSTGNSTGPHLHFEERADSDVVHPWFHAVRFVFGSTLASQNCVDVPVAGNFLGRRPAEVAVYRRGEVSSFQIHRPDAAPKVVQFGTATDQPVPGDWDGDGRLNVGVRSPETRKFRMRTPAGESTLVFGKRKDLPVAGDWDGDGDWEVGVRKAGRPTFRLRAADGAVTRVSLGDVDDLPLTGDWDGDRRTDLGVFDVDTATFTLRIVDDEGLPWTAQVRFGQPGDLPVAGDWDGNGRTDIGTWNPLSAVFSQRRAPNPVAAEARSVSEVTFGNPR